ncbi:MAG: bifunctional phosphopantothenoylcysteine decarboxylase/phosphopantothenate--cysteine ligase CoaBC [Nitrospirota bacterium]
MPKKVLFGITGSIAAYKSVQIIRSLTLAGFEVQVVRTSAARHFVADLPLQVLSKNPVHSELFDPNSGEVLHVSLATGFDLILIAPITADFMAKMALGLADDLLSALLLSTPTPIVIAPAMDLGMWDHPAVQKNTATLIERGCTIVDPEAGPLASGLSGIGRMADEKKIVEKVFELLLKKPAAENLPLKKEVVLVTAGPTREAIDPVRFISNRSSGKMGYAIAKAANEFGAEVILISGPVGINPPIGVKTIAVESSAEMKEAVTRYATSATIVIMAAAVCDYTPDNPASQKVKKKPHALSLRVTDDILQGLAKDKKGKILVGFAAETENVFENALSKLKKKNLDLIIANDVTVPGAGFDCETNIADIIDAKGQKTPLPKMSKSDLAQKILEAVIKLVRERNR